MSRSQAGVPDQVRDRLWERGLERSGKEMQIFLYGQGEFAGGFDRFDHTRSPATPCPAMSNAVPWSTEVRRNFSPIVRLTVP